MTITNAIEPSNAVDKLFGVLAETSTYKRLLFLFVGFPLGLAFFVSTVVLLSVGLALTPIVVGIAVLAVGLWVVTAYARVERTMMASLLGAAFRPEARAGAGIRGRILDPAAWKRVAYFVARLPVSVVGFVVSVVMVLSVTLLFTPLIYTVLPIMVGPERVTEWQEALLISCAGAVLALASAHAVRAVADVERRLAEWLL